MYKIFYGTEDTKVDITDIVFQQCAEGAVVVIPRGDGLRSKLYTDPAPGSIKKVFIFKDGALSSIIPKHEEFRIPLNNISFDTSKYTIGKYSYGVPVILFGNDANLTVGNFTQFASNVRIYLGGNHHTNWVTTYPFGHTKRKIFHHHGSGHPTTKGDVIIGNDVWIGDHSTIMSGVRIGDGAVIAANSHIVKDVEPYAVVGGNPAKTIKMRFTPEQINKLLRIQWWDWDIDKINKNLHLLCSTHIDEFLEKH